MPNDIANTGTISATSLNLILTDEFTSFATTFNAFNFRNLAITAENDFNNYTPFDLDNLTIKTGGNFTNYGNFTAGNFTATVTNLQNNSIINVDSLTATAESYLNNQPYATINAISLTATAGETFRNSIGSVINTASLNVTAKNFNTNTDSTIDADTVTIEVANFANNISNVGIVSSDSLNFILTDDFTHESDSFTNFNNFSNLAITTEGTFTNNATINPTGNLVITTDGAFTNNDTIDLDGNLTITANSFNNSRRGG